MARFIAMYSAPSDPEAFDQHYREVHIPLANQLPGLRRYTLSKNARLIRGQEPWYLIAELEWDDIGRVVPTNGRVVPTNGHA